MQRSRQLSFFRTVLRPYHGVASLFLVASLLTAASDALSIGLLVPLLGSLQQVENVQHLPRLLQPLAGYFYSLPANQQIPALVAAIVLAVLGKDLLLAFSIFLGYWLTGRVVADVRRQAMELLMEVGIEFYHCTRIGQVVDTVMHNTSRIETVIMQAAQFVVYLVSFLTLLSVLTMLSWQLTLVVLLLGLIILGLLSRYMRAIAGAGARATADRQTLAGLVQETIAGMPVIRYFSRQESQMAQVRDSIEAYRSSSLRLLFGNFAAPVVTEALGVIAVGLLFLAATTSYPLDSPMRLAQLLTFMYVLTRMMPVAKILNRDRAEIAGSWPFVLPVCQLLVREDKPFLADGERLFGGLQQGIEFRSVTFAYADGEKTALRDVSCVFPRGKTTAIVGETGAGKSTIINLLLRFYDPQGGAVLVDGRPLPDYRVQSYRRRIGYVSQDTFVFHDTVANNIAFGAPAPVPMESVVEAATRAGAHGFISELPQGYDTLVGDRGVRLSGGERQRLAIARAILKDPDMLILDEATSALDTGTEQSIQRSLDDLRRHKTVIQIAHRLSTIRRADQIVVLKAGRVVEVGREAELLARHGEYYRLAHGHD